MERGEVWMFKREQKQLKREEVMEAKKMVWAGSDR
jgi:hypothetical protein